jgi:hypothetical protein
MPTPETIDRDTPADAAGGREAPDAVVDTLAEPTVEEDSIDAAPQDDIDTVLDTEPERNDTATAEETDAALDGHRRQLTERIERSRRLPRGLREQFTRLVDQVALDAAGEEQPSLRLSDALAIVEESIPEQLLLDPERTQAARHVHGESFFTGDARQLSDEEAASIASSQLAGAGFRPRTADS